MRVVIDAPQRRSLSANEKRIYQLLCQGLTSVEVAQKLHIRHGTLHEYMMNTHDTPIETVVNLITSIREKGWEIPEPKKNTKEENEMPKGQKISPEKTAEIKALRSDGKTYPEIATAANVSRTTVARVCQKEKEPAPTDVDTSSKENNHNTSISDNSGNVNTIEKIPEIVLDSLTDTLEDLYGHKREISEVIENLKKRIKIEKGHFYDVEKNIAALKKYIRSIGYGDVLTVIDSEQKRGKEPDA